MKTIINHYNNQTKRTQEPPPTSPDQSTSEVPDPTSATSVPSEPSTSRRKGTRIRKKTKRFTSGQSELGTLLTSEGDEFDDPKLDPDELFLNHVQLYSEGAAHGEDRKSVV